MTKRDRQAMEYAIEQAEIRASKEKNNAVNRAMELMTVPMKDLPPLAIEFMRLLSSEVGYCMETCITAYAAYAQCVENLPCDDYLYEAREKDKKWFKHKLEKMKND